MTVLASAAARQAEATADLASIGNAATLTFYSGTRPATPDTALSGNTVLAQFTWSAAAGTATGGVIGFTIPPAATAAANGTATWARIATSAGAGVFDMDISTTAAGTGDIQLPTTTISTGLQVSISSLSLTEN